MRKKSVSKGMSMQLVRTPFINIFKQSKNQMYFIVLNSTNNAKVPVGIYLFQENSFSGCDSDISSDIRLSVESQNEIYNHFSLHLLNVKFSDHQMSVTQHW